MFDLGLGSSHALVTGASGGIGLATVQAFLDQDALVSAHYNSNSQSLADAFGSNERVCAVKASIESEEEVTQMFADSRKKLGKAVNMLVVNHAYIGLTDYHIKDMPLAEWQKTINVNLTGTFLVVKAFLNQLQYVAEEDKHKISVVFIGSTAGLFGEAGHSDYASTKSALMAGLQLSLKNEIVALAPLARVNTVNPGWVRTPAVADVLKNPDVVYAALASTPLKKLAEPVDIANVVLGLSSWRMSGHVTGQSVMVHGGMEGRLLNKPGSV